MLELCDQIILTKRPVPCAQQIRREVDEGEQAVTSAEALALVQPGLICKPSSDLEQVA